MHSVIIGEEVNDSVIKVLSGQHTFHHIDKVAQHSTLSCIARDVKQEDIGELWRDCLVDSAWMDVYPLGPSTR